MSALKKEVKLKVKKELPEIVQTARRCPKCHKMTLVYDPEHHRIYCTNCGFERRLKA